MFVFFVTLFLTVTERLHWFYSAKFRNRANTEVNHKLFIPQVSPVSFTTEKIIINFFTIIILKRTQFKNECLLLVRSLQILGDFQRHKTSK